MQALDSTIIEFDLSNLSFKKIAIEELHIDLQDKNKIYWIHCNLHQPDTLKTLTTTLQLPEELINLCGHNDPIPKLIDTDDTLTIKIQCLESTEPNAEKEIIFNTLFVYLTEQFCFTAASEPIAVLSEFVSSYHKAIRYAKTPCFILFLLFDITINDYAKTLFNYELIVDDMDLEVRKTHHNIYNEVINAKQQVMKVKRHAIAAREVLMRISGRKIAVISEQCHASLYNLSNHSHMIINETDSIRDMMNSMLGQIDNALMQKMNETMRILTTFAAIFLPLSLITGIYGMNFQWIPELSWKYGYYYALGLIFLCGFSLFLIFKKMKWF